jgi:small subunit ribosomal protein S8
MTLNDPLANALSHLLNCEEDAKSEAYVRPASKVLRQVLAILNHEGYIGAFSEIDDGKGKVLKVSLLGRINKCNVIKPRFSVQKETYTKYEKRFLPARGFGILIVSTNQGLMTQATAESKGIGGKLIAYCY